MNRWLQRCWQHAMRRLGYPGLIALALLVPTLAIVAWMPRVVRQADELRAALSAQADALTRRVQPVHRVPIGEHLVGFVAGFPPLTQSAADLDQVFATAQRLKVNLLKGEYQLQAEPNTPLVTYTATFPVHIEYGGLKDFASEVLTTLPHASMDELRMARSDASTGVLDSVVRFTFVYRSQ